MNKNGLELFIYYAVFIAVGSFLYEAEFNKYYTHSGIPFVDILVKMLYIAFIVFVVQLILVAVNDTLKEHYKKTAEQMFTIVYLIGVLIFFGFIYFPAIIKEQVLLENMTKIYNKIDELDYTERDELLEEIQNLSDVSDFMNDDLNDEGI